MGKVIFNVAGMRLLLISKIAVADQMYHLGDQWHHLLSPCATGLAGTLSKTKTR